MTETPKLPLSETHQQANILLSSVDIGNVPQSAKEAFFVCAKIDEDTAHRIGLDSLSVLRHPNGDASYIGTVPGESDDNISEEDTFVADTDPQGAVTGIGEIRFFKSFNGMPGMVGHPFVGYTLTTGPRRQGLGTRRLLTMDTIARQKYEEPLRSGAHEEPEAQALWERLVSEGRAVRLPAEADFRYIFL